ncbi:MAG: bifunctional methylenetetrahydrofolate dehydrogenase/methenyltetrahydrofolate cyclohydrolase FolD [Neomegalonema sp.]|nr:bifunctional methylenetetrahydrofolate dehydrogenase/methenyltetrahydrofolate cyclohydrolase FolD [Neomegalonema sp.]
MSAEIIDGKAFAADLRVKIAAAASALVKSKGVTPGLAVVLVGDDPASQVYVANKARQTAEAGMRSFEHRLADDVAETALLALIAQLNADPAIHGVLVQLPLPAHIDSDKVLAAIDPAKDVDGFHPINVGRLSIGAKALTPCTPLGCILLLKDRLGDLSGRDALVLGRSNIVGKPMAQLLLQANATVTIAHSRSRHAVEMAARSDILIAAVGRPQMVGADWIKPGATVIDVGINRVPAPERGLKDDGSPKTRLVGDVDFEAAKQVAGAITPVPGGVGPMTIACLLANTVTACARSLGEPDPDGLTAN